MPRLSSILIADLKALHDAGSGGEPTGPGIVTITVRQDYDYCHLRLYFCFCDDRGSASLNITVAQADRKVSGRTSRTKGGVPV